MSKFKLEVTETVVYYIYVEADSVDQALEVGNVAFNSRYEVNTGFSHIEDQVFQVVDE